MLMLNWPDLSLTGSRKITQQSSLYAQTIVRLSLSLSFHWIPPTSSVQIDFKSPTALLTSLTLDYILSISLSAIG